MSLILAILHLIVNGLMIFIYERICNNYRDIICDQDETITNLLEEMSALRRSKNG